MKDKLRKVRADGFASNESEYIVGVVGAAVPIHGADNQVVAALTISAPRSRRTLEQIHTMVPTVKTYAERMRRSIAQQS